MQSQPASLLQPRVTPRSSDDNSQGTGIELAELFGLGRGPREVGEAQEVTEVSKDSVKFVPVENNIKIFSLTHIEGECKYLMSSVFCTP